MSNVGSAVTSHWFSRNFALALFAAICTAHSLRAGDSSDGKSTLDDGKSALPTTTEETPEEYKNWIELGIGGLNISGDAAQFEQQHHMSGDVYGGIQDMHYEQTIGKNTTFSVDGHAIWDNNDYDVTLKLDQPGLGYIHAGFTEFRDWYDGNGGFFPPHGGTWFAPAIPEMYVDRGEAWVELGLRLPNWPELTLRYSHEFRQGEKDSTIWGDSTLTGIPLTNNPARKIAPAYRDIDETRDIISFDAVKTFGNTDFDLGMRYEHNDNDDKLQLERGAGQFATISGTPPTITGPNGTAAAQRFITQREDDSLDMYSGHIFTETRFTDSLWFTTGYSYTTLGADLTGTRIIGPDYNSTIDDPILTLQSNDHGFLDLAGTSETFEHVFNANLFWIPLQDLSLLTAFRYTHQNADSDAMLLDTSTTANVAPFTLTNPKGGFHRTTPTPRTEDTSNEFDNFAERLELRYTHIENWLFYAEGEWEEEWGDVHEHEVINNVDQGALNKDTNMLWQKYTIGANWYPMPRLDLSGQYYYKIVDYNNDYDSEFATPTDVPPVPGSERNQRLISQDWATNDFNIRITCRPKVPTILGTLSFVTRYDYMQTAVSGKWGVSPAGMPPAVPPPPPAIPTGTVFNEEDTALITNHVISESINWNPLARLYLQAVGSYVLNQTKTPAANINLIPNTSPTVVNFRDDYWTITGSAGFVLDDKTDLHADYTFYCANDHFKNSAVALPYGIGATENTVSAGISRQITKQVRLSIKYSYFDYVDETFGGHNNYRVHSVYSGFQFRF